MLIFIKGREQFDALKNEGVKIVMTVKTANERFPLVLGEYRRNELLDVELYASLDKTSKMYTKRTANEFLNEMLEKHNKYVKERERELESEKDLENLKLFDVMEFNKIINTYKNLKEGKFIITANKASYMANFEMHDFFEPSYRLNDNRCTIYRLYAKIDSYTEQEEIQKRIGYLFDSDDFRIDESLEMVLPFDKNDLFVKDFVEL